MWRRGRTWYLKRDIPGIGRVYKTLGTTRVAVAREREELLIRLAERGYLEPVRGWLDGALRLPALVEATPRAACTSWPNASGLLMCRWPRPSPVAWRRRPPTCAPSPWSATAPAWRTSSVSSARRRPFAQRSRPTRCRDFLYTLVPELEALIEEQRASTDAVEKKKGQIVTYLFHRNGQPVRTFRTAWRAACKRVGLAAQAAREGTTSKALLKTMSKEDRRAFKGLQRIPHDFRRTAVRNLIRAGVSQKVAMELTDHLTPSVFDRYNITDDRDRRDAVAKLAAAARDRQVVPFKRGGSKVSLGGIKVSDIAARWEVRAAEENVPFITGFSRLSLD